jgi:hypothetical protein
MYIVYKHNIMDIENDTFNLGVKIADIFACRKNMGVTSTLPEKLIINTKWGVDNYMEIIIPTSDITHDEYPVSYKTDNMIIKLPCDFPYAGVKYLVEKYPHRVISKANYADLFSEDVNKSWICGLHTANISGYTGIIDTNDFSNAKCLIARDCPGLYNTDGLEKIEEVDFSGCKNLASVNGLKYAHTVRLSGCINISDISALQCKKYVDISGCVNITDLGHIGHAKYLDASGCTRLTIDGRLPQRGNCLDAGISLEKNHDVIINFSGCTGLRDVSIYNYAKILNLSGCTRITDECVNNLVNVNDLNLSDCVQITDFAFYDFDHTNDLDIIWGNTTSQMLGYGSGTPYTMSKGLQFSSVPDKKLGMQKLNISGCTGVTRVKKLRNIPSLDISRCINVLDVMSVSNVKDLTYTGCTQLIDEDWYVIDERGHKYMPDHYAELIASGNHCNVRYPIPFGGGRLTILG